MTRQSLQDRESGYDFNIKLPIKLTLAEVQYTVERLKQIGAPGHHVLPNFKEIEFHVQEHYMVPFVQGYIQGLVHIMKDIRKLHRKMKKQQQEIENRKG